MYACMQDVAAELVAAADEEGNGHGMHGSAALTILLAPIPHKHARMHTPM